MLAYFKNNKRALFVLAVFLGFAVVWWPLIHFGHQSNAHHILDWFAGTYGVVALLGSIWGLQISKKWGGWRSVVGRCIQMFALGLLIQELGQLVFAYYAIFLNNEAPYPSLADIGFFGSIFFYIYGAYLLAKASGAHVSLRKAGNKTIALLLPIALLITSYLLFLRGYEFDWSHPLTVILDFGYPLGQATYVAIAILAFVLSRKLLGGAMHDKIILIIIALCAQYVADSNFLFEASRNTWQTAQYGDVLYLVSYTIMALALLNISPQTFAAAKSTSSEPQAAGTPPRTIEQTPSEATDQLAGPDNSSLETGAQNTEGKES